MNGSSTQLDFIDANNALLLLADVVEYVEYVEYIEYLCNRRIETQIRVQASACNEIKTQQ